MAETPIIAVQLNIEPDRTDSQVDAHFHAVGQCGLSHCRIVVHAEYCPEGGFGIYDAAFLSARKHSVRIVLSISGQKDFYLSVVRHFASSPQLLAWEYRDGECDYDSIKAIDPDHEIIVTGKSLTDFAKDSPKDALGVSVMPGLDYGWFPRRRIGKAVAAFCDMASSAAGDKPFWVTELQGGSNIYSGEHCFTPTPHEISQWIWTAIGAGAKGIIIKSLNSPEDELLAGEMSLLNLQGRMTPRAEEVSSIARTISQRPELFASVTPVKSPVTVIYTRESLLAEKKLCRTGSFDPDYEMRYEGAVVKSFVAAYELISDRGIIPDLREISEYDWDIADARGRCVVFAGQIAVPTGYYPRIAGFVKRGGFVFVEGLSFCFDEHMNSVFSREFPLANVFGGYVEEYSCRPGCYKVRIGKHKLWTQLFAGYVRNEASGESLRMLRNKYGRGRVLWIPSAIAFGAAASEHRKLITSFLKKELEGIMESLPMVFSRRRYAVTMHQMQTPEGLMTIVSNNSAHRKRVKFLGGKRVSSIVYMNYYHDHPAKARNRKIKLRTGQTAVVLWKDKEQ